MKGNSEGSCMSKWNSLSREECCQKVGREEFNFLIKVSPHSRCHTHLYMQNVTSMKEWKKDLREKFKPCPLSHLLPTLSHCQKSVGGGHFHAVKTLWLKHTQINQTSDHCQIILSYILPFVSLMVKLSKRIKMAKNNQSLKHSQNRWLSLCLLSACSCASATGGDEWIHTSLKSSFILFAIFFSFFFFLLNPFSPISSPSPPN